MRLFPFLPSSSLRVLTSSGPVFPEMKTALRSYHPVPSLQKTDGNLQDAPRIKNCLKAALLPEELKGTPPSTPQEIRERAVCRQPSFIIDVWRTLTPLQNAGLLPPTSVVNLIFVLSNSSHAMVRHT